MMFRKKMIGVDFERRKEKVRRMRLELTRRNRHYPLKVACIPISPPAHGRCPEQDSNLHVVTNTSP